MKISHWIADLITGGALSRAVNEAAEARDAAASVIHNMHQQNMRDDVAHQSQIDHIYDETRAILDRQFITDAPSWRALDAIKEWQAARADGDYSRLEASLAAINVSS